MTDLTFDSDCEICKFFTEIVEKRDLDTMILKEKVLRWQNPEYAEAAQDHLGNHILNEIFQKVAAMQVEQWKSRHGQD